MSAIHKSVRKKYVFPSYSKDEAICMGTKKDCWALIDKGLSSIRYGGGLSSEIKYLYIKPTLSNLKRTKDVNFLTKNLHYLWCPLPLLKFLSDNELCENISTLILDSREEYITNNLYTDFTFSSFSFKENLKSLNFIGDCKKASLLWSELKFDISKFCNLEYVSTPLNNKVLDVLLYSDFPALKHLDFSGVSDVKINDVLSKFSAIESLSLTSINTDLNFEHLKQCKSIRLNNAKTIDCVIFKNLHALEEILMMGVKKVINVHLLMDLPGLKNLEIINCSKPIKKKMKEDFEAKNLNLLNIDYA